MNLVFLSLNLVLFRNNSDNTDTDLRICKQTCTVCALLSIVSKSNQNRAKNKKKHRAGYKGNSHLAGDLK